MSYLIWTIGIIAAALGLLSLTVYCVVIANLQRSGLNQLADKASYTGKKYWVVAFICLVVLYLKG